VNVHIRTWHQDDLEAVRYILWETWKETYSSFIPMDDMQAYFHEQYTVQKLSDQYHDANVIGFIAEADDILAGYEKTSYSEKEQRLYVHQLYILSVYQNLGIGRKLMNSAAERAISLGLDEVWLGVMHKNISALAWYKKMGYEIVDRAPFTMGNTTVDHFIGYVPVGRILSKNT